MAAASMCSDESDQFSQWLEGRLLQLNADLDVSVFVMYICGILESYSGYDDKKESLLDIVGEIAEENKESVCDELIHKWDEISNTNSKSQEATNTAIDDKLSQMLSNTHVTSNNAEKKGKPLSEEDKARKAAILAQYSNVCDEPDLIDVEGVEDIVEAGGAAPSSTVGLIAAAAASITPGPPPTSVGVMQNQNKENVFKREKDQRDKMKQENEKKKEKDKQDRDVQKNKKQDRKDMEKKRTQKGERRR